MANGEHTKISKDGILPIEPGSQEDLDAIMAEAPNFIPATGANIEDFFPEAVAEEKAYMNRVSRGFQIWYSELKVKANQLYKRLTSKSNSSDQL